MSAPSLCRKFPNLPQTFRSHLVFFCTSIQLPSLLSRGRPRYLKCSTPSTRSSPSFPYYLKSVYPDLSIISVSLRFKLISVSLSLMAVILCLHIRATSICILQWLHRGRGKGPYCRIVFFSFQCGYIKFSLIIPGFCSLSVHPSTRHSPYFNTYGNYTTYVSVPPPPTSTSQVCGMSVLWVCSIWCRSNDASIIVRNSSQLTLVLFHPLNMDPSHVSLRLYSATPCFPHVNPGVHIIALFLPIIVFITTLSDIMATSVSVVVFRWVYGQLCICLTHITLWCDIPPPILTHAELPDSHRLPDAPPLPLLPTQC